MMDLVCRQGGLPVRVRTCLQQADADRREVLKAECTWAFQVFFANAACGPKVHSDTAPCDPLTHRSFNNRILKIIAY